MLLELTKCRRRASRRSLTTDLRIYWKNGERSGIVAKPKTEDRQQSPVHNKLTRTNDIHKAGVEQSKLSPDKMETRESPRLRLNKHGSSELERYKMEIGYNKPKQQLWNMTISFGRKCTIWKKIIFTIDQSSPIKKAANRVVKTFLI